METGLETARKWSKEKTIREYTNENILRHIREAKKIKDGYYGFNHLAYPVGSERAKIDEYIHNLERWVK